MRFGRTVPEGFLPVFSVDTEEEAERLLVLGCPVSLSGEYVAVELAEKQTLERLYAFGDRLEGLYEKYIKDGERQ